MHKIELSPLELDPESGLAREPPRKANLRQPDYEDEFDYHTILYDVFFGPNGRDVIGIGPPPSNVMPNILPLLRRGFCWPIVSQFEHHEMDRCWEMRVRRPRTRIVFPAGTFRQMTLEVRPNFHQQFKGKRVTVTKSRDNALHWIRDWSYFLAKAHSCNAILLYDNGSTNASLDEIENTIASVPGIEAVVVVSWPYKFGPQGGKRSRWDSDYCQYGLLQHARHRFLSSAEAVLQVDIDELVITKGGRSVFELAAKSNAGYVCFGGRWIENATDNVPDPASRRHRDYRYYDAVYDRMPVEKKWAVVPMMCPPEAQWRIHSILGMTHDGEASAQISLRHFKAINTNWIFGRWLPERPDLTCHKIDEELVEWLRVFDDDVSEGCSGTALGADIQLRA